MVFPHELAQTTAPSATSAAVVPNVLAARPHRACDCRRSHRAASWRLHEVSLRRAAKPVRALPFVDEGDRREARLRSRNWRRWHAARSASSDLSLPLTRRSIQAVFRRRRHQARRPPLAKTRPGSPAPAIGAGTGAPKLMMPVAPLFVFNTSAAKNAAGVTGLPPGLVAACKSATKVAAVRPGAVTVKTRTLLPAPRLGERLASAP